MRTTRSSSARLRTTWSASTPTPSKCRPPAASHLGSRRSSSAGWPARPVTAARTPRTSAARADLWPGLRQDPRLRAGRHVSNRRADAPTRAPADRTPPPDTSDRTPTPAGAPTPGPGSDAGRALTDGDRTDETQSRLPRAGGPGQAQHPPVHRRRREGAAGPRRELPPHRRARGERVGGRARARRPPPRPRHPRARHRDACIPDRDADIVLYCGGGFRSALAAENLQKMGYRRVHLHGRRHARLARGRLPRGPSRALRCPAASPTIRRPGSCSTATYLHRQAALAGVAAGPPAAAQRARDPRVLDHRVPDLDQRGGGDRPTTRW